ncbi:MAG: ParB/RepB/Spo0J family partition protein [Deltaproteobacteria bacterium]|nr:ParB/RepB/Spo0J family partition protein [Deltaproteobacteria bacterium]
MTAHKRKALGRGLKALIPVSDKARADVGVFECPVESLTPNEKQPRQSFDEAKLRELTESVRSQGVIQPLVVRADGGRYQIVAGERRWRAARLAGLKTVPVVVKDLGESQMIEIALIENIQREDLNPLEEAEAYRQLVDEYGLTQEQLAKRVGRQRSTVANALRLLKLPEDVQNYLLTGELSMGHARALLGLENSSAQKAMARKVVRGQLSVRACEDLVRGGQQEPEKRRAKRIKKYTPSQRRLVESLQRRLGTKVDLCSGTKGGRLVIHYYNPQELDRILDVIEG